MCQGERKRCDGWHQIACRSPQDDGPGARVNDETPNEEPKATERNRMAIHIEDAAHSRLVEGIAVQLSLDPLFLQPEELQRPEILATIALFVADEPVARRFRELEAQAEHTGMAIQPALVAVVQEAAAPQATIPDPRGEQLYDGLLIMPLLPSAILAQLSVVLYAHRSNVRRYESALDELVLNRRIFRSVTSGISIASATDPELPLTYVNPAFEVISGYSFEEVQGKNCRFLQGSDNDQPGLVLVREAIREQRKTVAVLKNYRKDGTPFWNELSISPVFDRTGKLTHFVGIQNDVTERVAFEEALRESEKLATAGRLAASIAHEINNPLEAVTNLLYLAQAEEVSVPVRNYLRHADQELRRVALLTSQSLRFYKQSSRPEAVRPGDLLSAVLDLYAAKIESAGIHVEARDRYEGSIVCYGSEIRQVISNLVRNALEAMKDGGDRLLVRIRPGRSWKTSLRGVTITIADTGEGMSRETQGKLFDAFYTTKGISGTGLGLWVSKEIIQRHHGRLALKSRQCGSRTGTVFSLFLPYQAATPEEKEVSHA